MYPYLCPGAAVPSSSATLPVCPALVQITSGYCPKTWEVSNTLTKTSIGNFCATPRYSSKYSCAANCVYTSQKLRQAQCAGLPDLLSYFQGDPQPLQPMAWLHRAQRAGNSLETCSVTPAPAFLPVAIVVLQLHDLSGRWGGRARAHQGLHLQDGPVHGT